MLSAHRSELLAAVAAIGLPAATAAAPPAPLAEPDWDELLRATVAHRLTGFLAAGVADGTWPATDTQADEAHEAHTRALSSVLMLEREMLRAAAALADAGVDVRVLKGPVTARTAYSEPGVRCFGDVDLLVRSRDFGTAAAALEAAGVHRTSPELRAGYDERFGKGATMRTTTGFEIDLHRTLCPGPYGILVPNEELFADPVVVELAGRRLLGLPARLQLLHSCLHASCGDPAPRWPALRDVAQLALQDDTSAAAMVETSSAWGVAAAAADAVTTCWTTFGLPATGLSRWASAFEPSGRDRRWLAMYHRSDRTWGAQALASVSAVRGLRRKAALLWAIAPLGRPRRNPRRRGSRSAAVLVPKGGSGR